MISAPEVEVAAVPNQPQVSIIVPAYNEEQAIAAVLDRIREAMDASPYPYETLVVDDGSRDRTADIVRARPWARLVQHRRNLGAGAALSTGLAEARADILAITDSDGTYPVEDIPRLVDHLLTHDHAMVVGARQREAGTMRWLRTPAKWFIRQLACYLTQTRIPDLNSGLRVFRREPAQALRGIYPPTHSWVSTITIGFLSNQESVAWLPIEYYPRKGRSHFHPIRDTYNYLSLVVRTVMYFNPLRIFLPLTTVLLAVAGAKLVRDLLTYRSFYVPSITLMLFVTALQIGALGLLADLIVRKTK